MTEKKTEIQFARIELNMMPDRKMILERQGKHPTAIEVTFLDSSHDEYSRTKIFMIGDDLTESTIHHIAMECTAVFLRIDDARWTPLTEASKVLDALRYLSNIRIKTDFIG